MSKVNVKESLLEVVKSNYLEILKIDLFNGEEAFARYCGRKSDKFCKTYTALEDLDFKVESFLLHDEVRGVVYCQDKDTKEPVWLESWGDDCSSWWQVSRVPKFYKDRLKDLNMKNMSKVSALTIIDDMIENYTRMMNAGNKKVLVVHARSFLKLIKQELELKEE